ncbi:ABC transporter ATP-binding protein [Aequorivita echinoideorum]|uniref:ABC transporter ATP-binding protein n=1 Tax=Aequorivita echinoideorum TaxID=1549647 RepID=A0ABS5S4Z6_9FLAO|nr:ABC transporter ATP-binding protein [Aequorivita echinoideorum]MBT0607437.1 ABC transporter ATP-binding protein [Aequorivita echinoideorum]
MENILEIKNLDKTFGKETVLKNINLSLKKNAVVSLLGASGSGKTTLLKIIAGLEHQNNGEIFLNGKEISNIKPQRRNIVYLYQEALLFPHLNAFENVAFGLRLRKTPEKDVKQKVMQMLEYLGMPNHATKMANQLSGGQRQRISFGRAMIIEPSLLLLDEPFGALDSTTRQKMQELFKELAKTMQLSALFVTHDLKEAIVMGDSIGKIMKGHLKQHSDLREFYEDEESGVKKEVEFWKQFIN